jgi:hypothetical protein
VSREHCLADSPHTPTGVGDQRLPTIDCGSTGHRNTRTPQPPKKGKEAHAARRPTPPMASKQIGTLLSSQETDAQTTRTGKQPPGPQRNGVTDTTNFSALLAAEPTRPCHTLQSCACSLSALPIRFSAFAFQTLADLPHY